jgi:D-arabinono-1,4-lactone oxidase/FAD binding domain
MLLKEHHTSAFARPLALQDGHRSWPIQLGVAWASLLCLVSLLARIPLGGVEGARMADSHAGTLFVVALVVYHLLFDVGTALGVAGVVLVARLMLGPSYGQVHLSPPLDVAIPLLLLGILSLPMLARAMRAPFPTDPWPIRLLRALHDLACASAHMTLLALLEHGYRPELRARLHAEARRQRIRRERLHWRNWGRTAACHPQVAFLPETAGDLVEIVAEARARKLRVRVAATGHSWPALATTSDVLVITHRLDMVTVDLDDPQRPLLIAEAGATNQQINDVLEQHGLTLPFNVVLESVRIGGLVATGSHGSGWETPTLSDLVEAIEIVSAAGDLVCYRAATHGPEVMSAVRLSLGLFGIIYRVHLRVEPNYRVQQRDTRVPIATMRAQIAELAPRHEALDIYYWPYQKYVTLRAWDRTDAPSVAATRKTWRRRFEHGAFALFHSAEQWVMRTWPTTTPAIAAFNYQWLPHHNRVTDVVEAIHWRDAIEMLRVSCIEFAFKLDPEFETFQQAWQDAIDVIDAFAAQGRYPFNMTLNARFISSSGCLLAPASGPGHTCYIEILSSSPTPYWQEFASAIAMRWMQLPGARPHWAKEWEFIPGIEAFIGHAYGDQIGQFLAVREALGVDPERMFSNELLDRVIFAHPTPQLAHQPDSGRALPVAEVAQSRSA